MKKNVFSIFILGAFLMSIAFSSASLAEEMEIKADIKAQELGVSVTDSVFIENAIRGYKNEKPFDVNNTGTSDLVFYTSLYGWDWIKNSCDIDPTPCTEGGIDDSYPEIFSNLRIDFGNGQDYVEGFSWTVEKPSEVGGVFQKTFGLVLDLTELEDGEDSFADAYIVFDVMPA